MSSKVVYMQFVAVLALKNVVSVVTIIYLTSIMYVPVGYLVRYFYSLWDLKLNVKGTLFTFAFQ